MCSGVRGLGFDEEYDQDLITEGVVNSPRYYRLASNSSQILDPDLNSIII